MARYSKLIAGIFGNSVALVLAYLATQWPAIAECTAADVCTVLGFSDVQITAALMLVVNAVFIERSRANAP